MASVAIYSSRSRANERVGRLKRDMDRSSGYTLSNLVSWLFVCLFKRRQRILKNTPNSISGTFNFFVRIICTNFYLICKLSWNKCYHMSIFNSIVLANSGKLGKSSKSVKNAHLIKLHSWFFKGQTHHKAVIWDGQKSRRYFCHMLRLYCIFLYNV